MRRLRLRLERQDQARSESKVPHHRVIYSRGWSFRERGEDEELSVVALTMTPGFAAPRFGQEFGGADQRQIASPPNKLHEDNPGLLMTPASFSCLTMPIFIGCRLRAK